MPKPLFAIQFLVEFEGSHENSPKPVAVQKFYLFIFYKNIFFKLSNAAAL